MPRHRPIKPVRKFVTAATVTQEELDRIRKASLAEERPVSSFNRRAILAAVEQVERQAEAASNG